MAALDAYWSKRNDEWRRYNGRRQAEIRMRLGLASFDWDQLCRDNTTDKREVAALFRQALNVLQQEAEPAVEESCGRGGSQDVGNSLSETEALAPSGDGVGAGGTVDGER